LLRGRGERGEKRVVEGKGEGKIKFFILFFLGVCLAEGSHII